jgi:hypothetical protein
MSIDIHLEQAQDKALHLLDEGASAEEALRAFLGNLDPMAEYYEGLRFGIQNMVFGGLDRYGARIFIQGRKYVYPPVQRIHI